MSEIILATLNARYIHASLGLRYLYANMGALQAQTEIMEFTIDLRPVDVVEKLLQQQPKIIGLGVYIWNIQQTTEVVQLLKQVAPEVVIVLGGPEVSYEYEGQPIVQAADYLITGVGDVSFAKLCADIAAGKAPITKVIAGEVVALDDLALPYQYYSDEDLKHRLLYVEASRGCPFKCEFCISSLDKTAKPFELARFMTEMDRLYQRGARHFKFVDRTFNLKVSASLAVLQFFLDRLDDQLFLHFEIIPDHLPDALKEMLTRFPAGSLQFEIGIQSFNQTVQDTISRKQNNDKSKANLAWIRQHTTAHIHADLIAGLPGENLASFAAGFNQLVALDPHEIQVGILKRLKGTPIIRHTEPFQMQYNPVPPFNIVQTADMDFVTLQRINRFARYWDMVANSGRFQATKSLILGDTPFERFMQLSDWIFKQTDQTHKIALPRLFALLYQALTEHFAEDKDTVVSCLLQDYQVSGIKGFPKFLDQQTVQQFQWRQQRQDGKTAPARQARHMQMPT